MGGGMNSTRVVFCLFLFASCAFLPFAAAETTFEGHEWVDLAFFSPDKEVTHEPAHPWYEGWSFPEQFHPKYSQLGGHIHVFIRNPWDTPLKVREIHLDGQFVEDLRDENLAVPWWRVMPHPIPPGGIAEAIIKLKHLPENEEHEIRFDAFSPTAQPRGKDQEITCTVNRTRIPPIELGYVSFNREMDEAYIYLERHAGSSAKVTRVFWDGEDVTDQAEFYSPEFFHRTALIKLSLDEALTYGAYHLVKVETDAGAATASMVRAWDCGFFPCAIFNLEWMHNLDTLPQLNLNLSSTYGHWMSIELLQELKRRNYKAIMGCGDRGRLTVETEIIEKINELDLPVFAYYMNDEADAKDFSCDKDPRVRKFQKLPEPERLGAHALLLEQAAAQYREAAPGTFNMFNIDSTYIPDNINMYAKIADVTSRSTYTQSHGRDPFFVYNTGYLLKRACAPRIPYLFPDAAWVEEWGLGRHVEPGEARLKMHYALAAGAKGITWWAWSPTPKTLKHGVQKSEPLQAELKRLHREVRTLQPLLSISEPLPETWAESDNEHLWTKTLLSADHSLILILVNRNYDVHEPGEIFRTPETAEPRFEYEPMEETEVTVNLPDWFRVEDVFAMPEAETMRFRRNDDRISMRIKELEFARMLVLTRDNGLRERLTKAWEETAKRRQRIAQSKETK